MATRTIRKHFILPKDLAEEFEREAGARNQSETLAGLIAEFLRRRAAASFFEAQAGFLSAKDHPEWETPEAVNRWVRDGRVAGWESEVGRALPGGEVDALPA